MLYERSVPHILEKIFFSLDYKSFKNCMDANKRWRELLTTVPYQNKLEKLRIEKKENQELLNDAVMRGKTEEVRAIISIGNVDVNHANRYGKTPLIFAARCGHNEIVKILLDSGADIDKEDIWKTTPLWYAAQWGRSVVIKTLIDRGAELERADECGITPLHAATQNGEKNTVQLLIDRGANPNKPDKVGKTPLH